MKITDNMQCTLVACAALLGSAQLHAQEWPKAPPRAAGEGEGPFQRLIIEAGMMIDGLGGAPTGPVLIVVEGNRIVELIHGSSQTGAMKRPEPRPGDKYIDARGSYVLPGLIDSHVRIIESYGRASTNPEYPLKLLLAHGITTISSQQRLGDQSDWALDLKKRSARNEVTGPRIEVWVEFGARSAEEAREKVRQAHKAGIGGFGEGWIEGTPDIMKAGLDEARKLGMPSIWHMDSTYTSRFNALDGARAGMTGVVHWYGLTEALLEGMSEPRFSDDLNLNKGRSKFGNFGRLWKQVAAPGSERWNTVIDELVSLKVVLEPTFSVYEAHRDIMAVSNAEWNREYLHPAFERDFRPGGGVSHLYDWTTSDEIEWKNNFRIWMQFVNDYRNRGGRVIAGSDAGYTWTLFGFGLVRNLEMLQEAGLSANQAIVAATLHSAEAMKIDDKVGSIEAGKFADLVIVDGNPLQNLKVLYGTGVTTLRPDGTAAQVGGVKYTIKDGIVYNAKAMLADVRKMVSEARAAKPSSGE